MNHLSWSLGFIRCILVRIWIIFKLIFKCCIYKSKIFILTSDKKKSFISTVFESFILKFPLFSRTEFSGAKRSKSNFAYNMLELSVIFVFLFVCLSDHNSWTPWLVCNHKFWVNNSVEPQECSYNLI